jgi:hypothetical protein
VICPKTRNDTSPKVHITTIVRLEAFRCRSGAGPIRHNYQQLDEKFKAAEGEGSLEGAWRLYHDSFDDNEPTVVAGIVSAFREHVRLVSPLNLSGTVKMLKEIGHANEAKRLLDYYIEKRGEESRSFFDLEKYPFGDDIDDPDVRSAFDAKYRSFQDDRSPAHVLVRIAKNQSWSRDDITLLSNLRADDFYDLFKQQNDEDLGRVVRARLQFAQIGGTDEEEKSISAKAREALVRIGKESSINRRRVRKFGVQVPDNIASQKAQDKSGAG